MDKPERIVDLEVRIRKALLVLLYMVIFSGALLMLYFGRSAIQFTLNVLSPFLVALIVAYIFNPIVAFLQIKFRVRRLPAILITYGIILGLTIGFFAILLPILYLQLKHGVAAIAEVLPQVPERVSAWLRVKLDPEDLQQVKAFLQKHIDLSLIGEKLSPVAQQTFETGKLLTRIVATVISIVIGFFAFSAFVVVITFYFLVDYHRMSYVARVLLPDDRESKVLELWSRIDRALGGFLRGQLLVSVIVGTIYSVALFAMGMNKYAILVGFLAGFGNLIPYLGPLLGGIPTALWVIFGSEFDDGTAKMIGLGLVVLLTMVIQGLDGFFLQPRIVGKNAELHPLLVMLALIIGAQFGLGGMVIAVPSAIICKSVLRELWWRPLEEIERSSKRASREKDAEKAAEAAAPA